jgi:hypothetical protein
MRRALLVALFVAAPALAQEPPPATQPAAPAAPAPPPPPPPSTATAGGANLDELQKEYERIRESLFAARARAAAVSSALYSSKVQVYLRYTTPRFFQVSRAVIRLDGASVFDDSSSAVATDNVLRFDGFVAPGKHQVTVRVDAETKDDPSYTTSTESTFTIDVPARRMVILRAEAKDDGHMGYSWGKKNKGSYKLHLDVAVEGKALADAPAAKTASR